MEKHVPTQKLIHVSILPRQLLVYNVSYLCNPGPEELI